MEILLFGITRDIVGKGSLSWPSERSRPQNVGALRKELTTWYPELGKLTSLGIAVNNEYAQDGDALDHAVEIALIPPVSGG